MPAGITDNALILGLAEMADRAFQGRLHYGDPGANGTENPISGNGYDHLTIARGSFTREGATGARFSNTNSLNWPTASGGAWGRSASNPDDVAYITLWYDESDPTNTVPANFDTLFATFQLTSPQRINDGDPFIIRAREMDLVST